MDELVEIYRKARETTKANRPKLEADTRKYLFAQIKAAAQEGYGRIEIADRYILPDILDELKMAGFLVSTPASGYIIQWSS